MTMMSDAAEHRILTWRVRSATWPAELAATYRAGSYDGVRLRLDSGVRLPDLEGLGELDGLRFMEVDGSVADDTAAFGLPQLRELRLLTRCRRPVPDITAALLTDLRMDDRPGKDRLCALAGLRDLVVWQWTEPDLRSLGGLRSLHRLCLEGAGRTISLTGIEGCAELTEVVLDLLRPDSLRALSALHRLRRIRIAGTPGVPADTDLDLAELAGLAELQELTLTFGAVRSAGPLLRMPGLESLRLRGTRIADGDHWPLSTLGHRIKVGRPED
jgi:hypothetical protein